MDDKNRMTAALALASSLCESSKLPPRRENLTPLSSTLAQGME